MIKRGKTSRELPEGVFGDGGPTTGCSGRCAARPAAELKH